MATALVFASCSADSSSDDGGSSDPVENPSSGGSGSDNPVVASEETKTGKISIVVNVDGTVTCGKCEKTYSTKAEAEACEHYKCATCGTVYYSEDDANDCTSHVTVTFKDVESTDDYTAQTAVTKTVKSSSSVSAPEWTRDKYVLSWVDESDAAVTFPVTLSVDEGETEKTVAYTAVWTASHTVTFKDADDGENESKTIEVADGLTISESDVPSWTKTHYTLSWNPSLDLSAAVTADATYTAVWTEDAKWLVTYKDADGGTNADETEYVYDGETPAKVPIWTKDGYNLSWNSDVTDVTTTSAIKQAVTFTAVWTEKGQWYGTLNFTSITKSDDGTDLTSDFKTAETVTVKDDIGNEQVFNIAKASSKMVIESNKGIKFQSTDAELSYTTLSDSKMILVFTIGSNNRSVTITAPNNENIIAGRGSKGSVLALTLPADSKTFTSSNTLATISSGVVTLTINKASSGKWAIKSTDGKSINITSVIVSSATD